MFLAAINRALLIDTSDPELDRAAEAWLAARDVKASVRSLVLDNDRAVAFVRAPHDVPRIARARRRADGRDARRHPASASTRSTGSSAARRPRRRFNPPRRGARAAADAT